MRAFEFAILAVMFAVVGFKALEAFALAIPLPV